MADVLRIAMDRRENVRREKSGLDDFIRMAEKLIRTHQDAGAASGADSFRYKSEAPPPTSSASAA